MKSLTATRQPPLAATWSLFVHLRLPFQLLLAPFFLWGWLMAGLGDPATFWLAFIALHAFLYGGATAFNSYYDHDEGPVGGLLRPPSIEPALLPFSLAAQALGVGLAGLANGWLAVISVAFVTLSAAYSHPRVRLKAHPVASLLAVAVGQGALAYLAGWAAARGELASAFTLPSLAALLAALLQVAGFYPLTQVFQVDEDKARGDRTTVVAWGPAGALALSRLLLGLGGIAMAAAVALRFGPADALLILLGTTMLVGSVTRWARHFDVRRVHLNYRVAMRVNGISAAAVGIYLSGRTLLGG